MVNVLNLCIPSNVSILIYVVIWDLYRILGSKYFSLRTLKKFDCSRASIVKYGVRQILPQSLSLW